MVLKGNKTKDWQWGGSARLTVGRLTANCRKDALTCLLHILEVRVGPALQKHATTLPNPTHSQSDAF